jgi:C-terminal processing protease CtpA/Prc
MKPLLLTMLLGGAVLAADDIRAVIGKLGADKFAEREAAQQQLLKLADTAHTNVLAACVSLYRQAQDPEVKTRLREIMETVVDKYLFRAPRGYLGVRLNRVNVRGGQLVVQGMIVPPGGVWISQVTADSPGAKAGLQPNDFIIGVDEKKWEGNVEKFIAAVQSKRPGEHLKLTVIRDNATNTADAVLGELPSELAEKIHTKERAAEFFERWLAERLDTEPANAEKRP